MLKKLLHIFKKFALLFICVFALITAYIIYFFVTSDAPAIHGMVKYHIPYNEKQTLDVYFPTQPAETNPVLLFIHGGGWIAGSKLSVNNNRFNQVFNELREQGFFVVSPDYTLAENGLSPFPDCILDTYAAVQWVKDHSDEYGWDMNQFGLMGESAGGHLALMAGYADATLFDSELPSIPPKYVVDVYGPTQLDSLYHASTTDSIKAFIKRLPASLAEQLDPARLLVGFDPESHPKAAEALFNIYSPINYLDSLAPPTLIIHGEADQVVPLSQSLLLAGRLDSLGINNPQHYMPGTNHAFQDATDEQKAEMQQIIVEFILNQTAQK